MLNSEWYPGTDLSNLLFMWALRESMLTEPNTSTTRENLAAAFGKSISTGWRGGPIFSQQALVEPVRAVSWSHASQTCPVPSISPDRGHGVETAGPRGEPNVLRSIFATRRSLAATRVIQARIDR